MKVRFFFFAVPDPCFFIVDELPLDRGPARVMGHDFARLSGQDFSLIVIVPSFVVSFDVKFLGINRQVIADMFW
jgi:hypothetical protein